MKIKPRRPYYDDQPDGYLESDRDYVMNNIDAAVKLLDRELVRQRQLARQRRQAASKGWRA